MSAARRLRERAGMTYAAGYRGVRRLFERAAPRSARVERELFDLRRPEPASRRFGLDRGRPIDRFYIESFLEEHSDDVRGRVLEIAEPTYTERFGDGRVSRSDVLDAAEEAPDATIHGDLATGEGIPPGAFDCFVLTQTLSLVYDVEAAVGHAREALAPGGVVLATVPGISHQSQVGIEEFPDYWRFTKLGLRRVFEKHFGAGDLEVRAYGNVVAACAFLRGLADHELEREWLEPHDPEYELLIAVRAVRR